MLGRAGLRMPLVLWLMRYSREHAQNTCHLYLLESLLFANWQSRGQHGNNGLRTTYLSRGKPGANIPCGIGPLGTETTAKGL